MSSNQLTKRTYEDCNIEEGITGTEQKKRRRSRWGGTETEKNVVDGLPVVVPHGLTKDQEEQYLLQLQIEEITRRLKTGELGIPADPRDRSPSPEPFYNHEGKRLNTREFRTRKKLEEERHRLVQRAIKSNPKYKPPADYRPLSSRVSDRVNIPQDEHPDVNLVGMLLGPRGNSLRNLEKETGTTIVIRGKGSVKEGKLTFKNGRPLPALDEPLHVFVTSSSMDNVKKALDKIKQIIHETLTLPDEENERLQRQMTQLAQLNGTFRDDDPLMKLRQLREAQTIVTNTIICSMCGAAGHIAADCKQKRLACDEPSSSEEYLPTSDKTTLDPEYMSLMAELGQGPRPPTLAHASSSSTSTPSMLATHRSPLALPPPTCSLPENSETPAKTITTTVTQTSPPPVITPRPRLCLPPPTLSSEPLPWKILPNVPSASEIPEELDGNLPAAPVSSLPQPSTGSDDTGDEMSSAGQSTSE